MLQYLNRLFQPQEWSPLGSSSGEQSQGFGSLMLGKSQCCAVGNNKPELLVLCKETVTMYLTQP